MRDPANSETPPTGPDKGRRVVVAFRTQGFASAARDLAPGRSASWSRQAWENVAWFGKRNEIWLKAKWRPSPTALHVIVAHDLDALEQKIIEAELASRATSASPLHIA